jgi:hypothetical protein
MCYMNAYIHILGLYYLGCCLVHAVFVVGLHDVCMCFANIASVVPAITCCTEGSSRSHHVLAETYDCNSIAARIG